ncbi:MAG: hypothetical protein QXJ07_01885 [Candidatus Bathyarchaeia archaeon]
MRRVYRYLPTSDTFSAVKVEYCPLCGEKLKRERFTRILFLFPYTFKILRHYENSHNEISKYARITRLAFTLFMWLAIHSFSAAVATRNIERVLNPQMPVIEIIPYILIPYLSVQLIIWVFFAYLLLWKKGSIFERK